MAQPKVDIQQQNGKLGRVAANEDGIAALVVSGIAASGLALNTEAVIFAPEEAEALGIDADYDADTANAGADPILVYQHIVDFFETAGRGAELHIMIVAQTNTLEDMVDKANPIAKKILTDNTGRIKLLSVARNPVTPYAPVITEGFDADVHNAVLKAKELRAEEESLYRYCSFFIEGRAFDGTPANAKDLRDSAGVLANRVSVVINSKPSVYEAEPEYEDYASVCLAMGRAAFNPVQRNIGRVRDGAVSEVEAGLSSNEPVADLTETELNLLHDKGYIFLKKHVTKSGFYFNDDNTATKIDDDYSSISNGRVIDKASRIAHAIYTDELLDDFDLNDDGTLPAGKITDFQTKIETEIAAQMNGEISDIQAFADPTQNVQSTDEVKIEIQIRRRGQAKLFTIELGFEPPTT